MRSPPSRRSRSARVAVALAALALVAPARAQTFQDEALMRALTLEQDAKHREAAAAYRALLGSPGGQRNLAPVILGLERVYSLYGASTMLLILALRRGQLSLLYPVISLTYVWVTILSVLIFQETLNVWKAIGLTSVVAGVGVLGWDGRR